MVSFWEKPRAQLRQRPYPWPNSSGSQQFCPTPWSRLSPLLPSARTARTNVAHQQHWGRSVAIPDINGKIEFERHVENEHGHQSFTVRTNSLLNHILSLLGFLLQATLSTVAHLWDWCTVCKAALQLCRLNVGGSQPPKRPASLQLWKEDRISLANPQWRYPYWESNNSMRYFTNIWFWWEIKISRTMYRYNLGKNQNLENNA